MRKVKHTFPLTILTAVILVVFIYQFSFIFPFTNNGFVVANVNPVAATVGGYITDIYVTNEQSVKKGQPLFTVFKKPYALAFKQAQSEVAEAKANLLVFKTQVEKTKSLIQAQKERFERLEFDYKHNKSALADNAVSQITVNTNLKEKNAAASQLQALVKELELNQQQVIAQEMKIKSLIARENNAKVSLDETTVYALHDGTVQDMFVALGTPITIHKPIFSLADTTTLFIQANFNETDLQWVRPGNKVYIYPRIYFGSKVYHGVVVSQNWSASRLNTHMTTQLQIIRNDERNWFLLPQRLPVQILITDYDPIHYPLNIGSSAYVYIHVL